ncbi:tRNA-dihydrouridine(47) synthase [NAD(P)(+)]-like [Sesamum angolense]|uniref:tRNA-dihydrouridine(47) synthase [NAD(P)(+)] n=1 Tax=Sesamum angolense TaxID=2727404 RepID=A0AAE1WXD6_9LAMI|nr:tRNA-dihydrouridine(47) synthase [NAD(P)(+)]-like [Sesamum angolense]
MPDPLLLDDTLNHVSAAEPPPLDEARPSPAELVAKAIAPVKRDFLRPPPVRTCDGNNSSKADERAAAQKDDASAPILKEKKSKRQLKRERRQEQKSALHICPEVAKSGKVSSCPYGDNCRFSHDLEAFKAQKPDDLDGMCPFLSTKGPCPYGLACRFAGTHKDDNGETANETINGDKRSSEMNVLKKDVQKLLWKNRMKFPKADAALKLLGLVARTKPFSLNTIPQNDNC